MQNWGMMMTETERSDKDIDALLALARRDGPSTSTDLLARVLKDAEAAQPSPPALAKKARSGVVNRMLAALGGWPALGGLVAATIVGFVVGISPSTMIDTPAAALFDQSDTLALYDADMSGLGWDMDEG